MSRVQYVSRLVPDYSFGVPFILLQYLHFLLFPHTGLHFSKAGDPAMNCILQFHCGKNTTFPQVMASMRAIHLSGVRGARQGQSWKCKEDVALWYESWASWPEWVVNEDPSDGKMEDLRHFCKQILLQGGTVWCKTGFCLSCKFFFFFYKNWGNHRQESAGFSKWLDLTHVVEWIFTFHRPQSTLRESSKKTKKKKIQSSFHNKAHTLHIISRFMNPLKPTMGFTSSAALLPKVSCSLS